MKTNVVGLIVFTLIASLLAPDLLAEDASLPKIVVLDFSNRAGPEYDFLRKPAADKLEILLFNTGLFSILERKRLPEIISEQGEFRGQAEENEALIVAIGEKAGANYVALGNIRKISHEARRYQGQIGKPMTNLMFSLDASLKIVDVRNGKTWYADEQTSKQALRESPGLTIEREGIHDELLEESCRKIVSRLQEKFPSLEKSSAGLGKTLISISSQPPGATIVVDGFTIGNTPLETPLSNRTQTIELKLEGFAPWKEQISPVEGMKINPQLMRYMPLPPLPPPVESSPLELKSRKITEEYQPQGGAEK